MVVRQGALVPLAPEAAFSLEAKIGHGVGPLLGGLAAGTALGALAARPGVWGPLGPAYPYGYPYGYPGYGVTVPVYYGPYDYYYRRRRPHFHRHGGRPGHR